MRRREFIIGFGGTVISWCLIGEATSAGQMRRVGILMTLSADDPVARGRALILREALRQLGWIEGHNIELDFHWAAHGHDELVIAAANLATSRADTILAIGSAAVAQLQVATQSSVPIVFAVVADPVGAGFVKSLARPGGNVTGFTPFEYGIGAKWLQLLREIAPWVRRVVALHDDTRVGAGQLDVIRKAAPSISVKIVDVGIGSGEEIAPAIAELARFSDGGLIVTASPAAAAHRKRIIALAADHRLPAIYPYRYFAADGGLVSYGPDAVDLRPAASYIDRILKGEKPADLPVQRPTRYELVFNLKTARALGLSLPPKLLARADGILD